MENKKKTNWFKIIMILLFLVYISLYSLNQSGYYDGSMRKKVEFTNEQIEKFELDIESGKVLDIEEYLVNQNKDYTNSISKMGYTMSTNVDKALNKGIKGILKILNKMLS